MLYLVFRLSVRIRTDPHFYAGLSLALQDLERSLVSMSQWAWLGPLNSHMGHSVQPLRHMNGRFSVGTRLMCQLRSVGFQPLNKLLQVLQT